MDGTTTDIFRTSSLKMKDTKQNKLKIDTKVSNMVINYFELL